MEMDNQVEEEVPKEQSEEVIDLDGEPIEIEESLETASDQAGETVTSEPAVTYIIYLSSLIRVFWGI